MRRRAFIFLLISLLVRTSRSSFCGNNGVPYSLEILADGSPVLGCAQPTCMAEPLDDYEDSTFIANAAGQEDGFFREGDRERKTFTSSLKPKAECPGTFSDLACNKKNQWVGGIDFIDHPRQPLVLQCCTFEGLRFSQDVGVTTISAGEAVTGGEVVRDGRQISFDVIANVRRLIDPDDPKRTYYEVTVRRMNCLPDPPEFEVAYDDDVESEIDRVLGNATNSAMETNGHKGHPHMDQEKKKKSKKPYKRKPKTSSTKNVISPLIGHEEIEKKGRTEPFIGSFGAPIFNPTAEKERNHDNFAEEYAPIPPLKHTKAPFTRHILTPKPRIVTTTTPKPTTAAPPAPVVNVQVEQPLPSTPAPVLFQFQPLPPFPQFPIGQNLMLPPYTAPAPPAPPPPPTPQHLFGVSQAAHLAPLPPPPSPFGLFVSHPQPFGIPQYGLNPVPPAAPAAPAPPTYGIQNIAQQNDQFKNLDSYTKSLLTDPTSPFALQAFGQPLAQQFNFGAQPQAEQNNFKNPQLQRVVIQAPTREQPAAPAHYSSQNVQVENQAVPKQNLLGELYRPPPFAALGTTLYNFQAHNG
ncbi:unnamed protein product [Caenorhabditis bovis]|uniref:WaRThog (Hedgehog-like family) n=1 Tax=Caenorhabditis bovis TaxID=2654633 RepID=A0A8S1ELG5_9PELO|nr:unnamed protein product [Caenorhabditis bovis]